MRNYRNINDQGHVAVIIETKGKRFVGITITC